MPNETKSDYNLIIDFGPAANTAENEVEDRAKSVMALLLKGRDNPGDIFSEWALEQMQRVADDGDLDTLFTEGPRSLDFLRAVAVVDSPYFWRLHKPNAQQQSPTSSKLHYLNIPLRLSNAGLVSLRRRAESMRQATGSSAYPTVKVVQRNNIRAVSLAKFRDLGTEMQHRAPGLHGGPSFGRRIDAEPALSLPRKKGKLWPKNNTQPSAIKPVNVVVVDQGMRPEYIDLLGGSGTYHAALVSQEPGPSPLEQSDRYLGWPQWHAHMVARNILSVAGGNGDEGAPIRIWDVNIVPDRTTRVVDEITAIYLRYIEIEKQIAQKPPNDEKWIIANAWGVKDRLRESPLGDYTDGDPSLNELTGLIYKLAAMGLVEIVFAAGNAGLFAHDPEAGPYDRGPGRSIWGAARLEQVYAVGSCDATGMWIGASAQGPAGAAEKPDLVTPSHFRENTDAHAISSGTSASCGLLAGLFARFWRQSNAPIVRSTFLGKAKRRRGSQPSADPGKRVGRGIATDI